LGTAFQFSIFDMYTYIYLYIYLYIAG